MCDCDCDCACVRLCLWCKHSKQRPNETITLVVIGSPQHWLVGAKHDARNNGTAAVCVAAFRLFTRLIITASMWIKLAKTTSRHISNQQRTTANVIPTTRNVLRKKSVGIRSTLFCRRLFVPPTRHRHRIDHEPPALPCPALPTTQTNVLRKSTYTSDDPSRPRPSSFRFILRIIPTTRESAAKLHDKQSQYRSNVATLCCGQWPEVREWARPLWPLRPTADYRAATWRLWRRGRDDRRRCSATVAFICSCRRTETRTSS